MDNKIYYKVSESNYTETQNNFTYFFSSKVNLRKFNERLEVNREEISNKLLSKYGIQFNCNTFCDFVLYSQIEKRGFHIIDDNGGVITWLNNIKLNGVITTLKH